jgi:hypothetical protein
MDDAKALGWQSSLLKAIGRDGQFELFDYVFADVSTGERVFVGISYETLGLSPEQLEAARAVQARYAAAPLGASERDGIWMAKAWPEAGGAVAAAR